MARYSPNNLYPVQRQPAVNPWLVRLPILIICGVVLLLASLAALVIAFQMRYSNLMMPGMSAYGINLSGMTREQAATALKQQFKYGDDAVFTFRYGDQFWQMTAAELGISFDVDATVDEAYNAGR